MSNSDNALPEDISDLERHFDNELLQTVQLLYDSLDETDQQRLTTLLNRMSDMGDKIEEKERQRKQLVKKLSTLDTKNTNLEDKNKELRKKVSNARKELQEYKQRKDQEAKQQQKDANVEFIEKIMPIYENINRALDNGNEKEVVDGIEIVRKKLNEFLLEQNVEFISPSKGEDTDPDLHDVMAKVDDSSVEEGAVVDCHRQGFKVNGTVKRPARVSISTGGS